MGNCKVQTSKSCAYLFPLRKTSSRVKAGGAHIEYIFILRGYLDEYSFRVPRITSPRAVLGRIFPSSSRL